MTTVCSKSKTDWVEYALLYFYDKGRTELLEYLSSSSFREYPNVEQNSNLENLWIQRERGVQVQLRENEIWYYDWSDTPLPTRYSYEDVGLLIYHLQYLGM